MTKWKIVKAQPVAITSARDKMPFEVTRSSRGFRGTVLLPLLRLPPRQRKRRRRTSRRQPHADH